MSVFLLSNEDNQERGDTLNHHSFGLPVGQRKTAASSPQTTGD